jgi:hypothetical protein
MPYLCKLFNLLLLNVIQLFCSRHDTDDIMKPPISFHGGQKYLELRTSQISLLEQFFFIRDVLNTNDTDTAAENMEFEAFFTCIYI